MSLSSTGGGGPSPVSLSSSSFLLNNSSSLLYQSHSTSLNSSSPSSLFMNHHQPPPPPGHHPLFISPPPPPPLVNSHSSTASTPPSSSSPSHMQILQTTSSTLSGGSSMSVYTPSPAMSSTQTGHFSSQLNAQNSLFNSSEGTNLYGQTNNPQSSLFNSSFLNSNLQASNYSSSPYALSSSNSLIMNGASSNNYFQNIQQQQIQQQNLQQQQAQHIQQPFHMQQQLPMHLQQPNNFQQQTANFQQQPNSFQQQFNQFQNVHTLQQNTQQQSQQFHSPQFQQSHLQSTIIQQSSHIQAHMQQQQIQTQQFNNNSNNIHTTQQQLTLQPPPPIYPPQQFNNNNLYAPNNIINSNFYSDINYSPPPRDEELCSTIHHVAEYCAKNSELEAYVRQNNGHEHKFRFLVGGEGSDYFKWVVYCIKNGLDASVAKNQTQSENIYTQEDNELIEIMKLYTEPQDILPLSQSQQKDLDDIIQSLEHQATPDNIRNARHWVEINSSTNSETYKQIANAIRQKFKNLLTFTQQLHLLYVVHDVLQNEMIKGDNQKQFINFFKPHLCWILRSCYQIALLLENQSEEKVSKILNLWLQRNIISDEEHQKFNKIMKSVKLPYYQPIQKTKRSRFDQGPGQIPIDVAPVNIVQSNTNNLQINSPIYGNYIPMIPPPPPPQPFVPMMNMVSPFQIPNTSVSPQFVAPPSMPLRGPPPPSSSSSSSSVMTNFDVPPEYYNNSNVCLSSSISVGLMASLLRGLSKRGKNMQTAFVPYKPLDSLSIIPPIQSNSDEIIAEKSRHFYDDLKQFNIKIHNNNNHHTKIEKPRHRRRSHSRSPSKHSSSHSRSPSRERLPFRRDSRLSDFDRPSSWASAEMGVDNDGSVLSSGGPKGERLGLGAGGDLIESDVFEKFRRQRANKYHEHIALNQASRRDSGGSRRITDSEKLCYICHQPGHIAKDCKYGLS